MFTKTGWRTLIIPRYYRSAQKSKYKEITCCSQSENMWDHSFQEQFENQYNIHLWKNKVSCDLSADGTCLPYLRQRDSNNNVLTFVPLNRGAFYWQLSAWGQPKREATRSIVLRADKENGNKYGKRLRAMCCIKTPRSRPLKY